jgi:hypothetical protein
VKESQKKIYILNGTELLQVDLWFGPSPLVGEDGR